MSVLWLPVSKVCRDRAADTSWWKSTEWSGVGSQWIKGCRTGEFWHAATAFLSWADVCTTLLFPWFGHFVQ